MRLDTITKIETFMADALLSSPQIPLGVNVVRLAASSDEEGLTHLARSITVRYTGSALNMEQTQPMSIYRRMTFEVTLASQSYLTQSGHDYAIQMCAGSYNTLTNQVPTGTGAQVIEAFHMTSEQFQGITDSTHYIYVQTWELTTQEINPLVALDPCVARGNCSYLFPSDTINRILPGDVLYQNKIFAPVLPPAAVGEPYEPELSGVIVQGNDLVYKDSPTEVFLTNWTTYSLVPTGEFDESGTMLRVNIYDRDGDLFMSTFFSNADGRKVIQIAGAAPASYNQLGGLWTSRPENSGNPSESGVESLPPVIATENEFGYINIMRGTLFADPTNPDGARVVVKYGALYPVQAGVTLTHDGEKYLYVGGTPLGKAWVRERDLTMLNSSQYFPKINCSDEAVIDGTTSETGDSQTGPIV